MKHLLFTLAAALLSVLVCGCVRSAVLPADSSVVSHSDSETPPEEESASKTQKTDEEVFQEAQNAPSNSIWGLLGAEMDLSRPSRAAHDDLIDQSFTEYTLTNGGTVGINSLGIVYIENYDLITEIRHEKDWNSILETLSAELEIQDYKVTAAGPDENGFSYIMKWEKPMGNITNPYDSVTVLFDAKTYQIWNLSRLSMGAETDAKPKLTLEQAVAIASERFDGTEATSVKLTYARPNAAVDTGEPPQYLSESRLSYIVKGPIKNGSVRVTVDAMTGEIIACTKAVWGAESE